MLRAGSTLAQVLQTNITTDYTDLASLVFLAGSILKAGFIIEACLRPPGSLVLPDYD